MRFIRSSALLFSVLTSVAFAQPMFDNPSPTSGGSTSQAANEMADKGMYKAIEYQNAARRGPTIVVIPGEIKSNNASFTQKFGSNNIADYAELELGKANFRVLERADMGPMLDEFRLAYTMGMPPYMLLDFDGDLGIAE